MKLILATLVFSVAAVSGFNLSRDSSGQLELRSRGVIPLAAFTVEGVKQFIRDNDIRNVDDFVTQLPQDIRERNTLIYDSRSIQGATYESPRVMMHSPDGKLTLAYTGAKNNHGDHIEALEFHAERTPMAWVLTDFAETANGLMVASSENQAVCLKCHGNPPKPIWGAYPKWPGVFGGSDDVVLPPNQKKIHESIQETDVDVNSLDLNVPLIYSDYTHLTHFLDSRNEPRYTALTFMKTSGSYGPYQTNYKYRESGQIVTTNRPNTRFSDFYADYQVAAIVQRVRNSAFFKRYQFSIYGYLLHSAGCRFKQADIISRLQNEVSVALPPSEISQDTTVIFVNVMRLMTVPKFFWNLEFDFTPFEIMHGPYGEHLDEQFTDEILKQAGRTTCDVLEDHVRDELQGDLYFASHKLEEATVTLPQGPWPKAAELCIDCHDPLNGERVGPPLAFRTPAEFRRESDASGELEVVKSRIDSKKLGAEKGGHRMPLGHPALTDREREDLIQYLENGP